MVVFLTRSYCFIVLWHLWGSSIVLWRNKSLPWAAEIALTLNDTCENFSATSVKCSNCVYVETPTWIQSLTAPGAARGVQSDVFGQLGSVEQVQFRCIRQSLDGERHKKTDIFVGLLGFRRRNQGFHKSKSEKVDSHWGSMQWTQLIEVSSPIAGRPSLTGATLVQNEQLWPHLRMSSNIIVILCNFPLWSIFFMSLVKKTPIDTSTSITRTWGLKLRTLRAWLSLASTVLYVQKYVRHVRYVSTWGQNTPHFDSDFCTSYQWILPRLTTRTRVNQIHLFLGFCIFGPDYVQLLSI